MFAVARYPVVVGCAVVVNEDIIVVAEVGVIAVVLVLVMVCVCDVVDAVGAGVVWLLMLKSYC